MNVFQNLKVFLLYFIGFVSGMGVSRWSTTMQVGRQLTGVSSFPSST